ncbi:hypothetical protein [Candidatus Pelagibacter bacterium nBUS_28]|jgi:hypothetical protein|uniref:hypothetical protein n=1 Tax=Candidatus Pelagibacter bacterium nBUS_28 TaxID=3374189 RepID=UPI003EBB6DA0
MSLKLLFIQLNEINFDLVDKYLSVSKKNKFKNLKIIRNTYKSFHTYAENKYENLEPWIQWVSVNLGKDFNDHNIFRLGDIVNFTKEKQIFEKIEERGFKVGAISPMNTDNRLKNPSYFLPDPWTNTHSDNSSFSKRLSLMLKQTINDNASGSLSFRSILTIMEIILKTFHFKKTLFLIKLIFSSLAKPWKKSLVLDYLIHLLHINFLKKKSPNFSSVFLNAGAHIQHHYFYNTKHLKNLPTNPGWYINPSFDPIEDMLDVYDKIIGDYLKLLKNENQLLVSTGLRQVPYDMVKFYYRLKNHSIFLNKIGINFSKVLPRMTRDFEIIFDNNKNLKIAKSILENIKSKKNDLKIFFEIEERDRSLFVVLTYPHEVERDDIIIINKNLELNFFNELVFVAIKNGMHDTKGYVFCSPNSHLISPKDPVHVSKLHNMILSYF